MANRSKFNQGRFGGRGAIALPIIAHSGGRWVFNGSRFNAFGSRAAARDTRAIIVIIADAVTAALNGASLSQVFTAERAYVPIHELKDLSTLRVSVVAASLEGALLDRSGRNLYSYVIDVGVQQAIGRGPMSAADINVVSDPLMLLAQEIADLFDGQSLETYPRARCVDVKNVPIYVPQHIDEMRVFTSVVSLTFRLGR
jgi:hypothetical protein